MVAVDNSTIEAKKERSLQDMIVSSIGKALRYM